MSRNPYDDPYDPDRAERERDDGGYDDRRAGRDAQAVARARGAAGAPAIFLILNGLFGLALVVLLSIPFVFQPDLYFKFMRDMLAQQPAGPQRQQQEQKLDDQEKEMKQDGAAFQIANAVQLGIPALVNVVAIVGGLMMRGLGNYSLSMTGAIASCVPCVTGCCVTGLPFGIWALVVLVRPEVKAGFAARRRGASAPDPY